MPNRCLKCDRTFGTVGALYDHLTATHPHEEVDIDVDEAQWGGL
ncbi:MAG: hypothetical protein WBK88_07015 [Methanothrix sp.]